jgi:hypothetical protein
MSGTDLPLKMLVRENIHDMVTIKFNAWMEARQLPGFIRLFICGVSRPNHY